MSQSILARLRDKTANSRLFFHLGADRQSRRTLVLLVFLPFLKKRLGLWRRRDFWSVSIRYRGRVFSIILRGDHDEITMIREIFIDESYNLKNVNFPIRSILDLGANIGLSAIYFAIHYPTAAVYAVEPDPRNFELLTKNIRAFPNIHGLPVAVAEKNGVADFYTVPGRSISSSLKPRLAGKKISVTTKNLDTLMTELNLSSLDILKCDIEGAEYDVLRSATSFSRVKYLFGEVHADLIGVPAEEFLALLRSQGFRWEFNKIGKAHRFSVVAERRHEI